MSANITLEAQSSDPAGPADGNSVCWLSDGTDTGDGGDVILRG